MNPTPTIGIIDDDAAMLRALERLVSGAGYSVTCWNSAESFLATRYAQTPDCLILDVSMPHTTGLDLQQQLAEKPAPIPLVFLTGKGDIPMSVRAMKAGAVDFLTKPVSEKDLFAAVETGIRISSTRRAALARFQSLTPREKEVFSHVISGRPNKRIAADLGTSEQTVKIHRMRLMDKLAETSLAGLVRLANLLGLEPAPAK